MFIISLFHWIFLFAFVFNSLKCVEFDRSIAGVTLSVYVKRSEWNHTTGKRDKIPDWKTYSLEDITTMLKVLNTKFTMVSTYGMGADNGKQKAANQQAQKTADFNAFDTLNFCKEPYQPNRPYSELNAQIMTAEAIALINKENRKKSLELLQGIWMNDPAQQVDNEIKVAFEYAEKANLIYPGSVTGLVFSHPAIGRQLWRTQRTFQQLQRIMEEAHRKGLKIGTRQYFCEGIIDEVNNEDSADAKMLQDVGRKMLQMSDFVVCSIEPSEQLAVNGPQVAFQPMQENFLRFRRELQKLHGGILEVMGEAKWASSGTHSWENLDNMRIFWEMMNKFAVENNMKMWLHTAFDNPWMTVISPSFPHIGWWKLRRNADINRMDGYIEKIHGQGESGDDTQPPKESSSADSSSSINPWVYVGIGFAVVVCIFVAILIFLYFRVNNLQDRLSKEEINEFWNGMSHESAAQSGQNAVEKALMIPYDKSFDIPKDKLKIDKHMLLGSGQFGIVYQAILERSDEKTDVALKVTRTDCPKTAFKSLLSEIKILTYLGQHPNIVSILGAYTVELENGIVYVATELCTLGSLENYLRRRTGKSFPENYANTASESVQVYLNEEEIAPVKMLERIQWSHEIACGMEYLGTKHVVHADLATRNVLLTSTKTAKITDFGLSRRLYDYTEYVKQQQEPLPWRWMAMESLKRLEFSSKSDVWSFGVTLWEIFADGDLPYPGLSWNVNFVEDLKNGLRMKSPPHATPEIYDLMVSCWHEEPNERPNFTDLKYTSGTLMTTK